MIKNWLMRNEYVAVGWVVVELHKAMAQIALIRYEETRLLEDNRTLICAAKDFVRVMEEELRLWHDMIKDLEAEADGELQLQLITGERN